MPTPPPDHRNITQIEPRLWEAADQLCANAKLTSSEYCMPAPGAFFLRHASNRQQAAAKAIADDQAAGRMPRRPLLKGDLIKRRALTLWPTARYGAWLKLPSEAKLGEAPVEAMNANSAPLPTSCFPAS